MTTSTTDRSHESIINDALARVLRERCNLPSAAAETLRAGKRPDIVVRLAEGPVVVETEVEPARTVEADALSRLGMDIGGQEVQNVFAVAVPESLRSTSQRHLYERIATARLRWQEWRIDGTSGPRLTGTALELGNAVARTSPPSSNLDEAVGILDDGARRAGSRLYASPGTLGRVSKVFGAEPGDNATANMAALVIINAMVFQERLASRETSFQPISSAVRDGRFSRMTLLQVWDHILSVDYWPIFSIARQVVRELTEVEAAEVLGECAETASELLATGAVGRHDLAGRVFNRLIADRKLLAAYYTTIPASTLLAGLALSPEGWQQVDWGDPERLGKLCVVDPACGTGTLLMAAYRQIVQNYSAVASAEADDPALHRILVERVINGADVVQAAIHLTAATLAAMSPSVRFEQMPLHTLRLGRGESDTIWLGSLDWLQAPATQSFFSGTKERIGATTGSGGVVQRPMADLVISNPPYVRRGSDGGRQEAISRVFSVPKRDAASEGAIAKRTSELLQGTPANQIAGHASSFTVLADRMVRPGGRVALVLPVTALSGESWRGVRRMLSDGYEIEYVVSSHDPALRSMSFDTEHRGGAASRAEAPMRMKRRRGGACSSTCGGRRTGKRTRWRWRGQCVPGASTPVPPVRRPARWRQCFDGRRRTVGRDHRGPGRGRAVVGRALAAGLDRTVRGGPGARRALERRTAQQVADADPCRAAWLIVCNVGPQASSDTRLDSACSMR